MESAYTAKGTRTIKGDRWVAAVIKTIRPQELTSRIIASNRNPPKKARAAGHGLSMQKTAAAIRFIAPSITGLQLFDLAGRRIVAINRKPGSSIELKGSPLRIAFRSGACIARVKVEDHDMIMTMPLVR
jgi:hypothetical protein